jgi:hypothetical protein
MGIVDGVATAEEKPKKQDKKGKMASDLYLEILRYVSIILNSG